MSTDISRLRDFIVRATEIVGATKDEAAVLDQMRPLLQDLVSHDDWLPEEYTRPHPQYYQQYLLHCDPLERISVVSFVWGPGQSTPVHDHTVWGLVGMLRGAETSESFERDAAGKLTKTDEEILRPGEICAVSPIVGDIHKVSNAVPDKPSISIHVYGANIGAVKRHVFVPDTGEVKSFVSGYANATTPNLWDRSREARGA
ncbi:cysteine dioxygenase [Xanthobacter tagetidis]|jgi:predicted metal-dependent enzyme (double-stranded beta helix superfamily)|uniref:Cysteine dioxygenase n=1 Tax=Xanthobacter tagetidis TaxID=60216 RepID=A0A3L7A5S2_9HYPH|nr:cysteine dioxygenase [Xanthobacter tagetidis]MBB6308852.1 putative metal-dependent enzyme (double-stranded beta helix superfamily) [Xanthobacter tagetidis]RLP74901.1 cysteine dioxygenase [Xanthobacter tagetidis]